MPTNLESAFREAIKVRTAALVVSRGRRAAANQKQIAELAAKNRLPAIYARGDYVANGGLMSYGADRDEPYRRVAVLVDRILEEPSLSDLPIEQTDEVRVGHQSQSGETDRSNDSA